MGKSKSKSKATRCDSAMAVDEPSWTVPASGVDMDTSAGNAPAQEQEISLAAPGGPKQRAQRGKSSRNQKLRRALRLDKALSVADKKVSKRLQPHACHLYQLVAGMLGRCWRLWSLKGHGVAAACVAPLQRTSCVGQWQLDDSRMDLKDGEHAQHNQQLPDCS
ncbi:hypothetical protein WJX74_000800 [Apatococcus lobatus]|uniref:Uncharacterized protein n=1 Tax=Apatococcus lobatus TaxID=904363 RepID=A0AAW1S1U8_9CHLO